MTKPKTAVPAVEDAPDPNENRTGVEPDESALSPEEKRLIGEVENKYTELRTAYEEKLEAHKQDSDDAIAAAKAEAKASLDALMNEVVDLEVKLQRMRKTRITGEHGDLDQPRTASAALGWDHDPKDRAVAHIRVLPNDPRETPEWAKSFEAALRTTPRELAEEHAKVIAAGNRFAREHFDPKASLSTDFGPGGGIWVAPTIERGVTRRLVEFSAIRSEARVVTAGGPIYEGVIRTTRRDTIEKAGERELFADPATEERRYEVVKIPVHDMRVRPALTQNMIDDSSADLAAELREDLSLDFAKEETRWFMTGTGLREALGLATTTAYPEVNSGIADDLDHGSITRLALDLPPFYRNNSQSSYCVSRGALTSLMLEEDALGRRSWQPSTQDGVPSRLNGWRWWEGVELDDVEAGAHPVFFGNFFLGYRIVDRMGLRVIRDDLTKVPLVIFNMTRRVGGGPWLEEALRRLKIAA